MENKLVTSKLFLDKRYEKDSGKYPVLLRVTFDRRSISLPTGKEFNFTQKEWDKMWEQKAFKTELEKLIAFKNTTRSIIDKIPHQRFTLDDFKERYKNKDIKQSEELHTIEGHFKDYEQFLWSLNQVKTARTYKCARASFEAFKPGMLLTDITPELLKQYQFYMLTTKSKSKATTYMYMRGLRKIINRAVQNGKFPAERKYYPFGKTSDEKFQIGTSPAKKNPLSSEVLKKLEGFKTDDKKKQYALDMWKLCFYCGGRNYADFLDLKYENVTDKTITLYRKKTANMTSEPVPVIIPIHKFIKEILDRRSQKNTGPKTYVFDILNDSMDESQRVYKREGFGKDCNEALALIAADLKIPVVKMQQARHTALNELKRKGFSVEAIQTIASHATTKTTKIYLEVEKTGVNTHLNALMPGKPKASRKTLKTA